MTSKLCLIGDLYRLLSDVGHLSYSIHHLQNYISSQPMQGTVNYGSSVASIDYPSTHSRLLSCCLPCQIRDCSVGSACESKSHALLNKQLFPVLNLTKGAMFRFIISRLLVLLVELATLIFLFVGESIMPF